MQQAASCVCGEGAESIADKHPSLKQPGQHPWQAKSSRPLATAFVARCPSPSAQSLPPVGCSFLTRSAQGLPAFLQILRCSGMPKVRGCAEVEPHTVVCFRSHTSPHDSRFPKGRALAGFPPRVLSPVFSGRSGHTQELTELPGGHHPPEPELGYR